MDKILFWIGANYTHFCIAKFFQKKTDYEIFGIFDVTNKPRKFFQTQKIVDFKKIWFYHDAIDEVDKKPDLKFLEEFEKKYDIPLTALVFSERIFMEYNEFYRFSTDQILRILELECRFYEKVLDEIKPNFIFMFEPYLHHEVLFFKLCKAKNIKVLELNATRFSSQGVIGFNDELKNYEKFTPSGKIRTFNQLRKYFEENHILKQNMDAINRSHGTTKDSILSAFQYFVLSDSNNVKTHYTYFGRNKLNVFKNYMQDIRRVKKRKKFIDKKFLKNIEDGKYILFALQTESESSLLLDAPLFTNPVDMIKKITNSMPIGYQLLVKEHPVQETRSWRSIETYKEIINTPGVVLIHPDLKIKEAIKKSSLVITVSSSVALDSLFYEVPSLMFSETAFSMIPSIGKVSDVRNLAEHIKTMSKTKVEAKHLEKYIQFSEKISFEFNPLGFAQNISDFFHFSGKLVDVDINEEQMIEFLNKEKTGLEILVNEYVKKIKNNN